MCHWWINIDWRNGGIDTISRPVEIQAFRNIEEMTRLLRKHGQKPKFTDFEWKILQLDLHLQLEVIPVAEFEIEKAKILGEKSKIRKPNIVLEIADKTGHSTNYISKCFENIEEKMRIRELFGLESLPKRRKIVKITKSNSIR